MIKTVLLDLDDVLNSFTMHSLKLMGCPVGPFDYHLYPRECRYNMVKAYNKLGPMRMGQDEFWRRLPPEVWWTAPISGEKENLLNWAVAKVGYKNVHIVTKPTRCPYSASGKVRWIQNNLEPSLQRNFAITPQKHLLAKPDVILIDDSEANVSKFRMQGGQAILMPRPWNSGTELRLPL